EHAADPGEVLDVERLIEAVLPADLLEHGGIALLAGHGQCRVAGEQLLQAEDDHRHEEQRRDQLQEALAEVQEHASLARPECIASPGAYASPHYATAIFDRPDCRDFCTGRMRTSAGRPSSACSFQIIPID